MADYQEMYLALFRKVTKAITILQEAQQEVEEMYISAEDLDIAVISREDISKKYKRRSFLSDRRLLSFFVALSCAMFTALNRQRRNILAR